VSTLQHIIKAHAADVEVFKNGGSMSYDLEEAVWGYLYDNGTIRNYDCVDCGELLAQTLADELGMAT
jgi:hypothetical protein